MKYLQVLEQLKIVSMTIDELVNELNELLDKEQNKKKRKPRTTLSSYKRYNLDIPYKLHSKYKSEYGDLIQWDGTHWFYIGQLSTMPYCLKKIIV